MFLIKAVAHVIYFLRYFPQTLTCSYTLPLVSPGDFDLQQVKESTYFFSWEACKGKPMEGDEWNWHCSREAAGPGVLTGFVSIRREDIDPAAPCLPPGPQLG